MTRNAVLATSLRFGITLTGALGIIACAVETGDGEYLIGEDPDDDIQVQQVGGIPVQLLHVSMHDGRWVNDPQDVWFDSSLQRQYGSPLQVQRDPFTGATELEIAAGTYAVSFRIPGTDTATVAFEPIEFRSDSSYVLAAFGEPGRLHTRVFELSRRSIEDGSQLTLWNLDPDARFRLEETPGWSRCSPEAGESVILADIGYDEVVTTSASGLVTIDRRPIWAGPFGPGLLMQLPRWDRDHVLPIEECLDEPGTPGEINEDGACVLPSGGVWGVALTPSGYDGGSCGTDDEE